MRSDDDRGFRDAMEALHMRRWVEGALTAAGAKCIGGGLCFVGDGESDIDFHYCGRHYWLEFKDIGPAKEKARVEPQQEEEE